MVDHFKGGDFHKINGVLRTAHSLTKRYRHEFKSQELWSEIKLVLEQFAEPFTELFISTMSLVSQHSENKPALLVCNEQLCPENPRMHFWWKKILRMHGILSRLLDNQPTITANFCI